MSRKYKLKGHESFVIRDGWLTKGMKAVASDNRYYKINSGADVLGVGTNMAKSIRYWLKAAELVTDTASKGINFTELGRIIYKYDPYLEDRFSLWIIHANIAANYELATSWNLFFNDINVTSAFTRDELFVMVKEAFIASTGEQEPSDRSLRDDCSAILQMYANNETKMVDPEDKNISPFEEFGLIQKNSGKYTKKRPFLDQIDPLVVLYLIVDRLNKDKSVQIDELTDGRDMPGRILNLNRIAVNSFLDDLQNKKYITVNRTAGLDIIYPDSCMELTKEEIVKTYFERNNEA